MSFANKIKLRILDVKQSLKDIATHSFVDEDTKNFRINICDTCPNLFKPIRTCRQCGCPVDIKSKLEHARCPINKW